MKILVVCPIWGYFGGREQYLIDVVEELVKRGHTCCVAYAELTNIPVKNGVAASVIKYNIPNLTYLKSAKDSQYANTLISILDREKPDVIFLNDIKNYILLRVFVNYGKLLAMMYYGWLFCLRDHRTLYLSRKACHRKLGFGCLFHACFLGKAIRKPEQFLRYNSLKNLHEVGRIYSEIDTILVKSQYMKNLFLQHGFCEGQIKNIGNITTLPHINITAVKEEANLLFLGRIDRYKGVDLLLKSLCKINSPFTCTIIGDGPHLLNCKHLAKKLNLEDSVQFLGWLPSEKIIPYLEKTRAVIIPSICPEAFARVALEAMSYGKPVIAFNSGGMSDCILDGKTGYLVPPKDTVDLANKIDCLLCNPEHARELGAAGKLLLKTRFDKNRHFDRLIKIFEETVSNNHFVRVTPSDRNHV